MKPSVAQIWISWLFAVVLCAITLVANIATYPSNGGLVAFLCFLPMVFLFFSYGQKSQLKYVESLERRLKALEQPAPEGS